jgi:hypothetical protein
MAFAGSTRTTTHCNQNAIKMAAKELPQFTLDSLRDGFQLSRGKWVASGNVVSGMRTCS